MLFAIAAEAAVPVGETLEAVVLVRQGSTTCAGVHLGEGVVATAYHCVAAGGRPAVTARSGAGWVGRVRAVSVALDLAVVEVELGEVDLAAAPVGPTPEVGARIWALGHPLGTDPPAGLLEGTLRWSAADGAVAAVGVHALQVTAPLNPGHSGGPVVDDDGRVVAIVGRRLAGQGLGFATRADRLPELLADGRRWPALGGTFALHPIGVNQTGGGGGNALGLRAELAARDRVLLDVAGYVPLSPRWAAARFGRSWSAIAEARIGLRQRLGRGPWAVRGDLAVGIAAVERWSRPPDDPLALRARVAPSPLVAAQLSSRTAGFELGWMPDTGVSRAAVVLRWPGVIRVW